MWETQTIKNMKRKTAICSFLSSKQLPENTYQKGNYNCTANLVFDWFGFDQTSKADANST